VSWSVEPGRADSPFFAREGRHRGSRSDSWAILGAFASETGCERRTAEGETLQTVQLACQRGGATIPLPRWPEILAGRCGMAIPSARDSLMAPTPHLRAVFRRADSPQLAESAAAHLRCVKDNPRLKRNMRDLDVATSPPREPVETPAGRFLPDRWRVLFKLQPRVIYVRLRRTPHKEKGRQIQRT